MKFLLPMSVLSLAVLIACGDAPKKPQKFSSILTRQRMHTNPHTFTDLKSENCEDFIVLISATKLARKLRKPKDWIVTNYQIPLFPDTSSSGRVIGHVLPGGECLIMKQQGPWYFVQSPGSNELGWLSQEFVVGFVKKDPETLVPCI